MLEHRLIRKEFCVFMHVVITKSLSMPAISSCQTGGICGLKSCFLFPKNAEEYSLCCAVFSPCSHTHRPEVFICARAGQLGPKDLSGECFLAFARIFSGVIRDGQTVHVLSAAYNPARPELKRQEVQVCGSMPRH
jgi:hypothetical protein